MSKLIPLSSKLYKEIYAIVDDEDYEALSKYKWKLNRHGYATRNIVSRKKENCSTVRMHRFIMMAEKGQFVDHINGNRLDNRKCNLRICTISENAHNRRKQTQRGLSVYTSKFIGVSKTRFNRWLAQIMKNYKRIYIGTYKTETEAALAYNQKALELFGECASLNTIE